jgi:hypothetical protein
MTLQLISCKSNPLPTQDVQLEIVVLAAFCYGFRQDAALHHYAMQPKRYV